jgi:uncharacterized membrane protein
VVNGIDVYAACSTTAQFEVVCAACDALGLRDVMKYIGVGISLGLCLGAALGAAMQNVAVGVAIGVALGSAFGMVFSGSSGELDRKKVASEKPLPHPLGL